MVVSLGSCLTAATLQSNSDAFLIKRKTCMSTTKKPPFLSIKIELPWAKQRAKSRGKCKFIKSLLWAFQWITHRHWTTHTHPGKPI